MLARDRFEVDRAVRAAEQATRLEFSVFVGPLGPDPRRYARSLHAALTAPRLSVLVAVDVDAGRVEVVTGEVARAALTDDHAEEAVAAMVGPFGVHQLTAGLVAGLAVLAQDVRRPALQPA